MVLTAMLAVVQLLAGSPMPDRSKVMIQTKRDTWSSRLGGLGVGLTTPPHKNIYETFKKGTNSPPRAVALMMMMMMVIAQKDLCLQP
jgi:hypothetical protein